MYGKKHLHLLENVVVQLLDDVPLEVEGRQGREATEVGPRNVLDVVLGQVQESEAAQISRWSKTFNLIGPFRFLSPVLKSVQDREKIRGLARNIKSMKMLFKKDETKKSFLVPSLRAVGTAFRWQPLRLRFFRDCSRPLRDPSDRVRLLSAILRVLSRSVTKALLGTNLILLLETSRLLRILPAINTTI